LILHRVTRIHAPIGEVFAFFSDGNNLARITPKKMRIQFVELPRQMGAGARVRYRVRVFGIPLNWTSRFTEWKENECFADAQERGPFRRFEHTHAFREVDGEVEMTDHVDYELPFGRLGKYVAGWPVKRELERLFDYRSKVIAEIFP